MCAFGAQICAHGDPPFPHGRRTHARPSCLRGKKAAQGAVVEAARFSEPERPSA